MSHSSDEGDYWPGYVDALTSMVQVLTFVMMLLALAVFVLSQSVSKGAVEEIAKAAKADVPKDASIEQMVAKVVEHITQQEATRAEQQAARDKEESTKSPIVQKSALLSKTEEKDLKAGKSEDSSPIKEAAEAVEGTTPNLSPPSGSKELSPAAGVQIGRATEIPEYARRISIRFSGKSYNFPSEYQEPVATFITNNRLVDGEKEITIRAYARGGAEGAVSESRRVAYYRGIVARGHLVEKKVPAAKIILRIFDTDDPEQGNSVDLIVNAGAHQ